MSNIFARLASVSCKKGIFLKMYILFDGDDVGDRNSTLQFTPIIGPGGDVNGAE